MVTGASQGIGASIARKLGARGHDLTLVARDRARLEALAAELRAAHGICAAPLPVDLGGAEAAHVVVAELARRGSRVDILVNNAGFGLLGPFAESPLEELLEMIRVNVMALVELTGLVLPTMLERRSGRILNLASTAAFQPGPALATYYATKAFVSSFSEALAVELRGSGVTVTTLYPGPTATGFQARAGMEGRLARLGAVTLGADAVAEAGVRGLLQGRDRVVPGLLNKIHASMVGLAPRRLVLTLAHAVNRKLRG